MTATDADRAKAAELVRALVTQRNSDALIEGIAAALAAERAAAVADLRARILALAKEWDGLAEHLRRGGERAATLRAAAHLRAAVTDTTGDPA